MFCSKCGNQVSDNQKFCNKCGSSLTQEDQFCKNCGATVNAQDNGGQFNNSNNGSMNYNQQGGSNNNVKYIVFGVVAIVALFAVMKIFGSNGSVKNNNTNNGGSTPNVTNVSQNTYKVSFDEHEISVPTNYKYFIQEDALFLADNTETWVARFDIANVSYAMYKTRIGSFQSVMKDGGYTCTTPELKKIAGLEFITMECNGDSNGYNLIFGLASANPSTSVLIQGRTVDNSVDYDILERNVSVIQSVTSSSSKSNISVNGEYVDNVLDVAKED